MLKKLVPVFFLAGCSSLSSSRIPAAENQGELCFREAEAVLNLLTEDSKVQESRLQSWIDRLSRSASKGSIPLESASGKAVSREVRILKAASKESRYQKIVDRFVEDDDREPFTSFADLAPHRPFERLRLALLAEYGIDLSRPTLSPKTKRFLFDLTENEFPGEPILHIHAPRKPGRFPRFFPDFHEEGSVEMLRVGDEKDLKRWMEQGIPSPAREIGIPNLEAIETQLMRNPELFYEVSSPAFLSPQFQEHFSPFLRSLRDPRRIKNQSLALVEDLRQGKISAFSLIRLKSGMAVPLPDASGIKNFVHAGAVEPAEILEAIHFRMERSGIIITRVSRMASRRLQRTPVSLDEVFP